MARKSGTLPGAAHNERARLRSAVLELGGYLGWQPHEVISFSEALTGCSWQRCGCADLEAVLEEYRSLIQVIEAKAVRSACPERHRGPRVETATACPARLAVSGGGGHAGHD